MKLEQISKCAHPLKHNRSVHLFIGLGLSEIWASEAMAAKASAVWDVTSGSLVGSHIGRRRQ